MNMTNNIKKKVIDTFFSKELAEESVDNSISIVASKLSISDELVTEIVINYLREHYENTI